MSLRSTYRPDSERLLRLIEDRGETITEFAASLGRHPGTFWNIKSGNQQFMSKAFALQLSAAFGKPVCDFTLPDGTAQAGEAQPQAKAS